ncbi:MAG: efflux RND transporter periplasmic adaptor subunit [Verrucomicrobiota bacterium]
MKRIILTIILIAAAIGGGFWWHKHHNAAAPETPAAEDQGPQVTHDAQGNTVVSMSDDDQGDAGIVFGNPAAGQWSQEGKGSGPAPDSTPLAGVLIPRDAVVLAEGAAWVYLVNKDKGGESFTRIKTPLDRLTDAGWFVTGTIKTDDYIVVTGAQKLLATELKPPGAEETTPTVVSVQTNALKLATLHRYVQGYGTVEPAPATAGAPAAGVSLAAPVAGVITKVAVVEGQRVEKGDLVVELNSGTLTLQNAEQEAARQRQLYAQQNTSQRNLQSAEAQLALLRVIAPMSGTVVHVNVKPGQSVDLPTVVAEVMDLNRLVVAAEIPAAEAKDLKAGNPIEVLTEPPVTTELAFVSPTVDKNNDTVLARLLLPAGGALRPGQFVPLRIVTEVHTNCLAAPAEGVVTDEGGQSVIALVKGDEATQTVVRSGLRENGWIEVAAPGLREGDAVVTLGAYGLPASTKIRVPSSSGDEAPTHSSNAK